MRSNAEDSLVSEYPGQASLPSNHRAYPVTASLNRCGAKLDDDTPADSRGAPQDLLFRLQKKTSVPPRLCLLGVPILQNARLGLEPPCPQPRKRPELSKEEVADSRQLIAAKYKCAEDAVLVHRILEGDARQKGVFAGEFSPCPRV